MKLWDVQIKASNFRHFSSLTKHSPMNSRKKNVALTDPLSFPLQAISFLLHQLLMPRHTLYPVAQWSYWAGTQVGNTHPPSCHSLLFLQSHLQSCRSLLAFRCPSSHPPPFPRDSTSWCRYSLALSCWPSQPSLLPHPYSVLSTTNTQKHILPRTHRGHTGLGLE